MTAIALSNDALRKAAPSIFADHPWERVSERYAFIPTIQVVDALRAEGFLPVKAMQSRTRIEGKGDFTKHMIRFRRAQDFEIVKGDELPEIVLVNSHDRSSSYQLSAGIFRLVCSNGMVVKSANYGDIKVQHSGNIVERVIEGSYSIINDMPRVIEQVETMKSIVLTPHQQDAFAKAALQLRYPADAAGNDKSPIEAEQLLRIRRYNDQSPSLWNTFQRVQENYIKGGLRGVTTTNKRTSTRAIKSVSEDIRLNKALWMLAEALGKAVA
jgi:hypothetical protein